MSTSTGRHHAPKRIRLTDRRRRTGMAVTASATLIAGLLSAPALATTTVSGGDAGSNPPVVRQSSVPISTDARALFYYRIGLTAGLANNANFAAESSGATAVVKGAGRACLGDNPAGVNKSPRVTITVKGPGTGPGSTTVATAVSPVRTPSLAGNTAPDDPQPSGPSDSSYRGDYPGTTGTHGFSFTADLTGRPAGIYTVTTETQSMVKTDTFSAGGVCTIGYPSPTNPKIAVLGTQSETTTFEYRPWQDTFVDVFGGGKVFANVVPAEYQFTVGSQTSALKSPGGQTFYTLPGTTSYSLPSDPAACASDPASCLPSTAVACDPTAGCAPRIMMINAVSGNERLQGTFDLQTKAFIALANLNGTQRVLMSLGTANDAEYHDLLVKLQDAAAAQGIDLASLLATKVRLRNGQYETTLSLLNGLQIAPSNKPGGLQIVTDTTVQAGVLLDIYIKLSSTTCTTSSATSATAPLSYTPSTGYGYTVTRTALPSVPAVGPLGAIAGGPIYHITGKFAAGALANTASAVIGVDTAADEPNGYPVWIEPFVASGHVASPKTLDFLGTATWSASESSLGALGCLSADALLGTGVAIYNNPLPVGFGTLLDPTLDATPTTDALNAQINTAVQTVLDTATANPVVSGVLNSLLAGLPI
jgi:hypothetical protein